VHPTQEFIVPANAPDAFAMIQPASAVVRRVVLLLAVAFGLAAGMPRSTDAVHAAVLVAQGEPGAPGHPPPGSKDAPAASAEVRPAPAPVAGGPATPAPGAATPDADQGSDAEAEKRPAARHGRGVTIDTNTIVIGRGDHAIRIQGDREYDSFDQFVEQAPWLAGLVFLALILFFVVPLLIVILLIWYKIRKARMQNETMIKLAEKGVVPPPEAMDTIAGRVPPGVAPSAVPLYEHARQLRRQASWSDLRKGVVLSAVGIAFLAYSVINEGSPGWVGLICLFLGLGYVVLWVLEDRGAPVRRDAGPPPAGGA
jgi:hypothetical protein